MDTAESESYEPLYIEGIEKFNECDYFESHELWEELWTEYRGSSRKFYQGLIQAAVAIYHFGNGNIRGARKLHGSARAYLEPYKPKHMGLDLDAFLMAFDTCLAEVAASRRESSRERPRTSSSASAGRSRQISSKSCAVSR